MNINTVKAIYKKELLEVLRDKKTLFVMVVLPLILYPALFIVIMQIVMLIEQGSQEKTYSVAYENVSEDNIDGISEWIASDKDELDYSFKRVSVDEDELSAALEDEQIDIYVSSSEDDGQIRYVIYYNSSINNSSNAADMYKEELEGYSKYIAEEALTERGENAQAILYPVTADMKDIATSESSMGYLLGMILPFMLLVGVLMGAMSPAIDATAGEKERGTLETLMCMPVSGEELIFGKFLSVATIALVSAFFDLISMLGIGVYFYSIIASVSDVSASFNVASFIPAILITVLCVLVYALFVSAVIMCVCAFAKSFKEANNYITPISLVIMLAGYVSFLPDVTLTPALSVIPVVNITLMVKELLNFNYDYGAIVLVLLSNIVYAFVSIWVLGRIYSSEEILFTEGGVSLRFLERRSNIKKGSLPTISESVFIMIVALLLMNYVGSVVVIRNPVLGILVQQGFVLLLPILTCWYIKGDFRKVFSLNIPGIQDIICFVPVLLGVTALNLALSNLLARVLPDSLENVNTQFDSLLSDMPFVTAFILIAVVPAVCEEMMFRGFMMSAFSRKGKPVYAIIAVAVLFALMHMSMIRFVPTFLLGSLLCFALYRSKSIYLTMLMHLINNGIAVYLTYYG